MRPRCSCRCCATARTWRRSPGRSGRSSRRGPGSPGSCSPATASTRGGAPSPRRTGTSRSSSSCSSAPPAGLVLHPSPGETGGSAMATVTLRDENRVLTEGGEIAAFLAPFGIWYRRFEGGELAVEPTDAEILAAYREPIEQLKAEGGYVTADVINVRPEMPGLDTMLAKFNREHWHDEDEVRFIVHGRGLFHVHPPAGPVFSIEVVQGDMIKVPQGTHHWFDLCSDKTIRAIRLFQDVSGWTPHYTGTGPETAYQP